SIHMFFFFSSRRRHTRSKRDWSSDVCSSDLISTSPRSERRNPGASQPAQGNARIFQSEPLRPLAEVSHETFESRIPRREERPIRSEERRVGKECRSGWWAES